MVEIKERPGMTDSVQESCSPPFCRANDSLHADERPSSGDMAEEMNDTVENGEDLEEGEISDDVEGEENASKEEESKENETSNTEGEAPPPAEKANVKSSHSSSKRDGHRNRDGKHERRSKREERREKRRRDDDGRDRSRKRRRDDKTDTSNKKHEQGSEHFEEEDEEMLFVRGASPSRAHPPRDDPAENRESNPTPEGQTSPGSKESRNRDEKPRRRSRSRSRNRQNDRPRDKDRDRRDRDRDRDHDRGRDRDGRIRRDRERDGKGRPPKSNESIMFMEGRSMKGEDCRYSHNGIPQRKMELCKFYIQDCCAKKDKCLYMHKEFPCKYHHTGAKKCRMGDKQCKFSHAPLTEVTKNILRRHLESAPKDLLGDYGRPPKRDEIPYQEEPQNPNKKMHIPSIFELNVRPPPGLPPVAFPEEKEESEIQPKPVPFSFALADDDDEENGLQIDLGDAPKVEEEKMEEDSVRENYGEVGEGTPVPENEYSSEDDGPKSLADVVKKVNDRATVPSSLPSIPLPGAPNQPNKLNIAAALESLSSEQLTEMLEMVKNKSGQQQQQPNQSPQQQPPSVPADPRRRPPVGLEPSGGTSPSTTVAAVPARDPRLTRDPRQRVDPRLKPAVAAPIPVASPPVQPKVNPLGTLTIPVKQESTKTGDVDLRGAFVLPPLTLSDKDYRQSDVDMRSFIGQAPINPFSSDVDLRTQLPDPLSVLPFRPAPMHPPAREIDASLMSHPPLEWKVRPIVVPKPDYSHVKFNPSDPKARLDPRLQRYFKKEIEDSVELPGLSSPPVYTPNVVYNPTLEKVHVPVYDPRADLHSSESFATQRFDPRLSRR